MFRELLPPRHTPPKCSTTTALRRPFTGLPDIPSRPPLCSRIFQPLSPSTIILPPPPFLRQQLPHSRWPRLFRCRLRRTRSLHRRSLPTPPISNGTFPHRSPRLRLRVPFPPGRLRSMGSRYPPGWHRQQGSPSRPPQPLARNARPDPRRLGRKKGRQ